MKILIKLKSSRGVVVFQFLSLVLFSFLLFSQKPHSKTFPKTKEILQLYPETYEQKPLSEQLHIQNTQYQKHIRH